MHIVIFVSKLYILTFYLYYWPFYSKPEIPVNAHTLQVCCSATKLLYFDFKATGTATDTLS